MIQENGIVFLLLCSVVGFIILTSMNTRKRQGLQSQQVADSHRPVFAPSANMPMILPHKEPFTVHYAKRDVIQTPMVPMQQVEVVSNCVPPYPPSSMTTETVEITCRHGQCSYQEPTVAPAEPTNAPAEPTVAPAEPTVAPSEPTMAPEQVYQQEQINREQKWRQQEEDNRQDQIRFERQQRIWQQEQQGQRFVDTGMVSIIPPEFNRRKRNRGISEFNPFMGNKIQ